MVTAAKGQNSSGTCLDEGVPGFSDRHAESFAIGILGDLHLEPDQMDIFHRAREQLSTLLVESGNDPQRSARVVQLGDLGGYSHRPGSHACFEVADEYLHGFPVPVALVTGNHDLEGDEFETDEENIRVWTQVFQQRHYWAAELGPAVCIGLSTVRFRSNSFSAHEVFIDEEQLHWFESALQAAGDRPVIVFTHAPPLGCGLKVLQEVHVKNRCAWLNHSGTPEVFIRLVERYDNIRLWFSGHFHLSHNYVDSISTAGGCAFVQTGVIGNCNRDGFRHSRVLKGDANGYSLYTIDHESGYLRLDLEHAWADKTSPTPVVPLEELLCDPEGDSGWLCSQLDCRLGGSEGELLDPVTGRRPGRAKWYPAGQRCLMALQNGMLVEYDALHQAAVGVVFLDVGETDEVVLLDAGGEPVPSTSQPEEDGSRAVAVELRNQFGSVIKRVERNAAGGFFAIFQQNKWRLKKAKQAAAAAAAASLAAAEGAKSRVEGAGEALLAR